MEALSTAVPAPRKASWPGLLAGLVLLAALAYLTNVLSHNVSKVLEYPLWAVLLGLAANGILTALGVKGYIQPAIRTELFLKVGLVLLGASVNITQIMSVGGRGVLQALVMITSVFFFTWWLGGRWKLPDTLRATMSTAISVCGVSAAIAAAGAVLARREELTYVTALVIITALPLMILMPFLASAMGLPAEVAGAWFGGNIDTTAAVVGAGTIYGEQAMQVASIVKMAQNALIGVVAFALALYFSTVVEKSGPRPGARVIWERFPKFVFGFVLTSVLASVGFFAKPEVTALNNLRSWAFTLAFICIGLELSFKEFRRLGAGPTYVYLVSTLFNTVLALGVAWVIFGGALF